MAKCRMIFDIYDIGLNTCDFITENKELNVFADKDYPQKLKEKVLSTAQIGLNKTQVCVFVDLSEDEIKNFFFLAGYGSARIAYKGKKWLNNRYDLILWEEYQKKIRLDTTD